jgi:arylsulfatase A-like enzyme
MRWLPVLLALGCGSEDGGKGRKKATGPATDTVPAFLGRVPKNVLMLSLDTFRRDHMHRYGGDDDTPFLNELARTGFPLDDHTTCSNWTFAGTTCTLLGSYNVERGHVPRLGRLKTPVPDGTELLASYLGEAGYHTILISPNAWLGPQWGNAQGYDVARHAPSERTTDVYQLGVTDLEQAIKEGADRWMLHLHFLEPHAAYRPPPEFAPELAAMEPYLINLGNRDLHYELRDTYKDLDPEEAKLLEAHLRTRYVGELRYLDMQISSIMSEFAHRGLLEDTLVVIWTDHGEQFWEHGNQTHAFDLHAEENAGIAMFWADNIVAGSWDGPTTAIDLVPTLLSLLDIPIPEEVTGVPVGQAPADRDRFGLSVARIGPVQMVVHDGWKLHYRWKGEIGLFDMEVDPQELDNRFDPEDPLTRDMWNRLLPMIERARPIVTEFGINWPAGLEHR